MKQIYIPMNIIAEDSNSILITIKDAAARQKGLVCPCCGAQLIVRAKESTHMQPHFKHENGAVCFTALRSAAKAPLQAHRQTSVANSLGSDIISEYKNRIEKVGEAVKIINRLKSEGLYEGYWNDLYCACKKLDYYDQLLLFSSISRKSCIDKVTFSKLRSAINTLSLNKVRLLINNSFGFKTVNVISLAPHSFICEKDGRLIKIESFSKETLPRGIFLSPSDIEVFAEKEFVEKQFRAVMAA